MNTSEPADGGNSTDIDAFEHELHHWMDASLFKWPYIYVKLIGAALFIPLCLAMIFYLKGKMEKVGIFMLVTYLLCFAAHLISARESIIEINDFHIWYSETLVVLFTLLSVVMQNYFVLELKRV